MDMTNEVKNIITKLDMSYEDIRIILLNATCEVEQELWEINTNMLTFPVKLNKNELHDLIEYFFLTEHDEGVYVTMYENKNVIVVECDHNPGFLMLVLTSLVIITAFILLLMVIL